MATDTFYATLPPLEHFLDVTQSQNFVSVPDDWYVLISDIVGSTEAIAAGRYKIVNLLGASSIIAVLNAIDRLEVPFIFGGDGASILVPPSVLHAARQALLATKQQAAQAFGMELRVGVVPVAVVTAANHAIKVAKVRVGAPLKAGGSNSSKLEVGNKLSGSSSQASFMGGGLTYATDLVKAKTTPNLYRLDACLDSTPADFSGLECRWHDIPSQHGYTLSLMVAATHQSGNADAVYRELIQNIQRICGSEDNYHPVKTAALKLTLRPRRLWAEVELRSPSVRKRDRWLCLLKIWLENLLGCLLIRFKAKTGDVDWGKYSQDVAAATDYQKFDDLLRMVIASSAPQIEQLAEYLEQCYRLGELVYGLHVSNRALMTCLVFDRNGHHLHFVDGADGGYALAATEFKARMHNKVVNWRAYADVAKLKAKKPPQKRLGGIA